MSELKATEFAPVGALVLVVEDDEAARLTTRITLEQAGYRVMEAADCASARAHFAEQTPDIILLDVLLPDGDGYSLCREFLAQPSGRDLPIAMVTGLGDIVSIHQAYESGATDFITKPVSWGTLPFRIQFILRAKQALRDASKHEAELRLWGKVFEGSNEAILITDADLRIILVNKPYEKITGFTEEEVVGVDTIKVGTQLHSHSFFRNLVHVLKEKGHWEGELINQRKNGEKFPTWYSISQVVDTDGQPENYIAIFSDISERKKSRERIDFLAHHDSLTELPNRALLNDRLEMVINTAKRRGEKAGILFIDLDRFKNINDSLGHAAGDLILRETAARLSDAVRTDDTVARLGGDEFVILLARIRDERSLAEVAMKVRDEILRPYMLEDMPLHLSPSIGIAVYPDDGEDPSTLIKNADAAMYLAKQKGRNNYQFYTPVLNARTLDRLKLEYDLRSALEQGQFELHYQPQVVDCSKQLYGAEALVRWRHPERGLVPPNHFIPLAEEIGLIIPLGAWVIAEAARQVKHWRESGFNDLVVSVNISALQFHQAGFLTEVQHLLTQAGTDPSAIELELTESMLMNDMEMSIQVLQAFRSLGYRIAIDDFGTGFSCLNYLRRLPANILKIDQSFVRDMQSDSASLAIVTSIIKLAQSLGMETIAEGVETAEECELLSNQGCRYMQGYYFAKPLPVAQFEDWVRQWGA